MLLFLVLLSFLLLMDLVTTLEQLLKREMSCFLDEGRVLL